MRISCARSRRILGIPLWAAALTLIWAGLVLAVALIARERGIAVNLCPLRSAAGIPCPTCGGTRAALALFAGRPVEAFLLNPLLAAAGAAGAAWLLARLVFGRSIRVELSRVERRAAWAAGAVLLAANWAYLIARGV